MFYNSTKRYLYKSLHGKALHKCNVLFLSKKPKSNYYTLIFTRFNGFLCKFYLTNKDAVLFVKLNEGNFVSRYEKSIVYKVDDITYCALTSDLL